MSLPRLKDEQALKSANRESIPMKSNHHTHSFYSDGSSHPEEYVIKAIELGFSSLGFTEHSPLPFENTFSFKPGKKQEYLELISKLQLKYKDSISIFLAMEMDYIPGMLEDFAPLREEFGLDYSIGSVHLVGSGSKENLWFIDGHDYRIYDEGLEKFFGGDIRKAVKAYYQQVNAMLETQHFDIIGHLDKIKMHNRNRFFREDEGWYIRLVAETLELVRQKGIIVEVNTRGIYKKRSDTTYPGLDILKLIRAAAVPVVINSDAHQPAELDGEFQYAASILREAGINETVKYSGSQWVKVPLGNI